MTGHAIPACPDAAQERRLARRLRPPPGRDDGSDVLLELAAEHAAVHQRLERLAPSRDPKALATAFRKTLAGWKRASRFLAYAEARAFGRELGDWLAQVERELLPVDPARALELVEDFITSDAKWFERADDSGGAVGSAVRAACRLWVRCAARCEAPAAQWPERLAQLFDGDDYGAREVLLREADALLDEAALRGLVARYEAQLDAVLERAHANGERGLPSAVFRVSAALSLLADALHDPDVKVRATLRYSPQPNELQKEKFALGYLEADRPADALRWLQEPWERHEDTRLSLRAQAMQQLGRTDEAAVLRQQVFERTLSVGDLRDWLELLPPNRQAPAIEHARTLARACADPVTAARLLLETEDGDGAQATLVAKAEHVDGGDYTRLVPLAEALEERALWVGATVVYRALLAQILARAYSPAYRHAARYWARLQAITQRAPSLAPLSSQAMFEAEVRRDHARKSSFWALVGK
ncbi:MAG: hypothetical protein HXY24_02610 [Rubrivivax sp.]|nr:hypothetical protein [Rubrivivax sp.]